MRKLTFLGTGHGMPKRSAGSAFFLSDGSSKLLMDCAGGYEIIARLHSANIGRNDLTNIFITHHDSDHILGIVPLMRLLSKTDQKVNLYCNSETLSAIESLFTFVAKKHWELAQSNLNIVVVEGGQKVQLNDWELEFIDTGKKVPMLGVKVTFPDGYKLVYPGDEPIYQSYEDALRSVDMLLLEAFCLSKDEAQYDPHGKNHSTVKESAAKAQELGVKHLALIHMEDDTLETRKVEYAREASSVFSGEVTVPVDLDEVEF